MNTGNKNIQHMGGQNSSLVVFRLTVHSIAGSILFWGNFPVEGIFPLELTWVQTPFPQKTLSDESINRGLVCAHMHFIAQTQKILTFMSLTGECRQQKHIQHAPSTKTECYYLNGWIKKRSHTQKSHPKMVNLRDIAGECRRRRRRISSIHYPNWSSETARWRRCGRQTRPKLHSLSRNMCGRYWIVGKVVVIRGPE